MRKITKSGGRAGGKNACTVWSGRDLLSLKSDDFGHTEREQGVRHFFGAVSKELYKGAL